jgi:serine/threonine-protein kinase
VSSIDLSPGSLFAGQFRIVRPLAKGGMGAVYVVEQVRTGRERALKLMHPMLVSDAKSIERFEREAQVGSRIESDHVVEVIAAGVEAVGPTPWICMELLKGETLADRLEKRGIPPRDEMVEIVKQLSHALTAAHRAGIVHRDLKPENIFLAESRREGVPFTLKVLDFGVATLVQGASEVGGPKTTQGVGSPLWMAPEQTNVGKVVLATDVWAVGLIVFHLLTGQSYWRTARTPGSTITALLVEIMVESLEPASVRAHEVAPNAALLPPGFDAWFSRCLVRDPTQRYADAMAAFPPLLAILSGVGQTQPITALGETAAVVSPPAQPPPRRSWPWVLLGTMGIGAFCVMGAVHQIVRGGEQIAHELATSAPELQGHFVDPETGATLDLGPDGLHLRAGDGQEIALASGAHPDAGVEAEGETATDSSDDEAEAGDEEEAGEEESEEESEEEESDDEEDSDDEGAEAPDESQPPRRPASAPIAQIVAGMERRRARRESRETSGTTVEPAIHRAFRTQIIDPCWRGSYEGELAPPRRRYAIHVVGTSIRVEAPRQSSAEQTFVTCIVSRAPGQPSGDYVYMLP